MDQQLVIKLTSGDGNGAPIGLVKSPPMLYKNLKDLYPTITFSEKATASETEPYWYGVFEWAWGPTNLPHTQSFDDIGLTKHQDGIWRPTFVVREATQEEIVERTANKSLEVRFERKQLLLDSDFSQLADAPSNVKENIEAWKAYRQSLRDIPSQPEFPWNVTFPTAP